MTLIPNTYLMLDSHHECLTINNHNIRVGLLLKCIDLKVLAFYGYGPCQWIVERLRPMYMERSFLNSTRPLSYYALYIHSVEPLATLLSPFTTDKAELRRPVHKAWPTRWGRKRASGTRCKTLHGVVNCWRVKKLQYSFSQMCMCVLTQGILTIDVCKHNTVREQLNRSHGVPKIPKISQITKS